MFLKKNTYLLLAFALLMFAGQTSAQSVSLAVGGDGSTTVSGSGTTITVDVSQMGITQSGNAIQIVFDVDTSVITLTGAPTGFLISGGNTASLLSITPVSMPASASFTFTTATDVTGVEFSIGISSISLAGAPLAGVPLPAALMFNNANNANPDFDGDGTIGIPDFLQFVNHFGTSRGDADYDAKYDLDGNGAIGIPDFLIFVDNFGSQVPPSGGGGGGSSSPDLIVESPSVSNSTLMTGESFTLSAMVRNSGAGASASTTLRYYRSSDATISTSDTEVGTDSVNGLSASGTSSESIGLTAPSTGGTYYYGACVESVGGESNTNNNCSTGVQVTVQAAADDHSNTRSGATSLSLDSSRSGQIETGSDADYFRVQVTGSGTLTVYTTGSLDTTGELQNSSGSVLSSNDDGGSGSNFRIERSVSAGTYYIKVEGYGSSTGSYTVHASFGSGSSSGSGSLGSCRVGMVVSPNQSCTVSGGELRNVGGGCVVYTPFGSGRICSGSFYLNGLIGTRVGSDFRIDAVP